MPRSPRTLSLWQHHSPNQPWLTQEINELSNPYVILTLQEEIKTLQKEFKLQEAVTTIGVQCIINSIEEQYIKELSKDYFGYANQIIKMLLTHLHMKCDCFTLPANKDKILTWYKPPKLD
jgi:hypothetical protein